MDIVDGQLATVEAPLGSDACKDRLWGTGALWLRGFWTVERAAQAAGAIEAARDRWTTDFDGEQFSLGRAWYTHLETQTTGAYFAHVAEARAVVEAVVPGLHAALRDAVASVVGAAVHDRAGWAGAGVHVFPEGKRCSLRGGSVHFDDQGLSRAQRSERCSALSLVLMLKAPDAGGGLRLWAARYQGRHRPRPEEVRGPSVELRSAPGDLLIFDSHRLHQIQPFQGGDRISATLHAAALPDGRWECWF